MRLVLWNGSPKAKGSASAVFLDYLAGQAGPEHTLCRVGGLKAPAAADFRGADALVLAFPLYVDGIPGHLLGMLEALEPDLRVLAPEAKVYAVINCGFFEAGQCAHAMELLRHWCRRAGLCWGRGVCVGGGGMANAAPLGRGGPLSPIARALDALAASVLSGGLGEDILAQPALPRRLYVAAAHLGWNKTGRKNGLSKADLCAPLEKGAPR